MEASPETPSVKTKSSDWSLANLNFMFLITTGYIIGEISHFLIGVTSKAGSVTSNGKLELSFMSGLFIHD